MLFTKISVLNEIRYSMGISDIGQTLIIDRKYTMIQVVMNLITLVKFVFCFFSPCLGGKWEVSNEPFSFDLNFSHYHFI